jgi:lipid-binding SYLF domain-containing protein
LFALVACSLASPSQADTGTVRVIFTKGGFIIGGCSGRGVLIFHGHRYPFRVEGMSIGFTIGASTTDFQGHALHLRHATDIQWHYGVIGAGGALAAGAGGVSLQNEKGVILQLAGGRVGVELSAAVGGVTLTLE